MKQTSGWGICCGGCGGAGSRAAEQRRQHGPGTVDVPGPFDSRAWARKGFRAEGAERCADAGYTRLGPRRTRSGAEGSRRQAPKKSLGSWMEMPDALVRATRPGEPFSACSQFLRVLRVKSQLSEG